MRPKPHNPVPVHTRNCHPQPNDVTCTCNEPGGGLDDFACAVPCGPLLQMESLANAMPLERCEVKTAAGTVQNKRYEFQTAANTVRFE